MADKLVPGDSLNEEVFSKFNGMADEVNELKKGGGGGSGGTAACKGLSQGKLPGRFHPYFPQQSGTPCGSGSILQSQGDRSGVRWHDRGDLNTK